MVQNFCKKNRKKLTHEGTVANHLLGGNVECHNTPRLVHERVKTIRRGKARGIKLKKVSALMSHSKNKKFKTARYF
jgi:hypothetical protein